MKNVTFVNNAPVILAGICGFAGGFGVCYLVMKEKFEEKSKQEVAEFKDQYSTKFASKWMDEVKKADDNLQTSVDIFGNDRKKDEDQTPDALKTLRNGPRSVKTDYNGYSTMKEEKARISDLKAELEHPVDSDEDDPNGKPSILSDAEASNIDASWDQLEVLYYMDSGDLVNADNMESIDIHDSVTQDILDEGAKEIGDGPNERRFIFVKVPSTHTLYIVTYMDEDDRIDETSYYDDNDEGEEE